MFDFIKRKTDVNDVPIGTVIRDTSPIPNTTHHTSLLEFHQKGVDICTELGFNNSEVDAFAMCFKGKINYSLKARVAYFKNVDSGHHANIETACLFLRQELQNLKAKMSIDANKSPDNIIV